MNDRVLYSITDARQLLGKMSRNMIYGLLRSGELPSVVIGMSRSALFDGSLSTVFDVVPRSRSRAL